MEIYSFFVSISNGRVYFWNKIRSRIKVFKPFEDVSRPSLSIDTIEISYVCVYKRASKAVMKGDRVECIEDARKE